jgi:hypothetical protein
MMSRVRKKVTVYSPYLLFSLGVYDKSTAWSMIMNMLAVVLFIPYFPPVGSYVGLYSVE